MKAKLEFDMPEDQGAFRLASHGVDWALVAWDIATGDLRTWLKHGHSFESADDALEAVRDLVYRVIDEHGVSLDDIE